MGFFSCFISIFVFPDADVTGDLNKCDFCVVVCSKVSVVGV